MIDKAYETNITAIYLITNYSNDTVYLTQKAFVTDMTADYPQQFECKWNYLEYINDAEAELVPNYYKWEIDKEKQWSSDEQYLEWLYFRRRQGFGKTKWEMKS